MPYQNRVTPFNELIATAARGTLTGNRGILHDEQARVVRPFAHRNWVACLLEFKGRRRQVMSPGQYTHLFFLDEATALAAGHRPCCECRRSDYVRFRAALAAALGRDANALKAGDMDRVLHADRVAGRGRQRFKRTFAAVFGSLPDGTMFHLGGNEPVALLKWQDMVWIWSPQGYGAPRTIDRRRPVEVLTPKATVDAFRVEYVPSVHISAAG